jgi:hypothetical protein
LLTERMNVVTIDFPVGSHHCKKLHFTFALSPERLRQVYDPSTPVFP